MTCKVHKSPVHGLGLFAEEPILKGERSYYSLPIYIHGADIFEQLLIDDRFFVFDNIYDLRESELQYLNHSDNPNMDYEEEGIKIRLEALRDIRKDEEIFINYGWSEERKKEVFEREAKN